MAEKQEEKNDEKKDALENQRKPDYAGRKREAA